MPPSLSAEEQAIVRSAVDALWRRGELRWKLDATQQILYDRIKGAKDLRYFLNCSRRLGKSFVMLALAVEICLKKKNARVIYVAPTAKDAADIATDNWLTLAEDCPEDIKGEYKAQSKELIFPNGSIIRFKATNGEHAKDLRGGRADIAVLDEAGTMDDFENVLYSIVEPMTASTGQHAAGMIVIATTPSETSGHDSGKVYESYAMQGFMSEFTLNDNPRMPYEEKRKILLRLGESPERIPGILRGELEPETTRAKREYYCQWVTEANRAVVPEYTAACRAEVLKEVERPPFRDCYVGMDPGMVDNTGILFGYWDFLGQRLVIEDEWVKKHAGTKEVAKAIADKEREHFVGMPNIWRVSDVEKRLIQDLRTDHQIQFFQSKKKDSNASIQLMRSWVQSGQIIIHPRCTNLDRQLKNAIWNRRGKDFERDNSEDSIDAHYDLVAALKYLVRFVNTNRNRNPYPATWGAPGADMHVPLRARAKQQGKLTPRNTIFDNTPTGRRLLKAQVRRVNKAK